MNPIRWALSLATDTARKASAVGAGFFEDAGDVPGQPVLTFGLRGWFDGATGAVELRKVRDQRGGAEGGGSTGVGVSMCA